MKWRRIVRENPGVRSESTRAARPLSRLAALTVIALAAAGCGKSTNDRVKVYPTNGQILWQGRPLAGAMVVLHPKGARDPRSLPARAATDKDGRFHATTYETADGAPAGEYAVTVQYYPLKRQGESYVPGPNSLPQKYANPATTDLSIRVAEAPTTLQPLNLRQ